MLLMLVMNVPQVNFAALFAFNLFSYHDTCFVLTDKRFFFPFENRARCNDSGGLWQHQYREAFTGAKTPRETPGNPRERMQNSSLSLNKFINIAFRFNFKNVCFNMPKVSSKEFHFNPLNTSLYAEGSAPAFAESFSVEDAATRLLGFITPRMNSITPPCAERQQRSATFISCCTS